jgi:3-hydroxyisobutyrate dehydrogenase-like beta-hydroxyacid dehydrogenase
MDMEREKIGVIGLGLMGTALTERLLNAGYPVFVFNRTRGKADALIDHGARWSDNPLELCDRVIISLFTSETVSEVLDNLANGLRPGQILIDTTTGSPDQTMALGKKMAEKGVVYLDAPISGSSEQTRRGEVTTIVGGDRSSFEACRDLFDCWSEKTIYAGPCGAAAQMKLVSNLVLGLNRAALAEGLVFAETLGLDAQAALDVLMGTMSYSRIMETKGSKMVAGDFSTQARLSQHLKDLRLISQAAAAGNQQLPLTALHQQLLEEAETAGFGDMDNSAVIHAVRNRKTARSVPGWDDQKRESD